MRRSASQYGRLVRAAREHRVLERVELILERGVDARDSRDRTG